MRGELRPYDIGRSTLRKLSYCALGYFLAGVLATECSAGQIELAVKLSPAIEQQLSLPENKIDVAPAALVFAKEFYPDIDPKAYSARIDALVAEAKRLANGSQDPETRIRVLNTVLFRYEGYHYDRSPFSRSRQDYYFLNGILDTKQGICYTMPLLYIAVAQRLGYPIYPVHAPDHVFVRYLDPSFQQQNIETTSGGKYIGDDLYIRDFAIGKRGLDSGSYMRTLTYHEFLADMLSANAFFWGRQNGQKSIAYVARARDIDPRTADYSESLGRSFGAMAKFVKSHEQQAEYRKIATHFSEQAQKLGYVSSQEIKTERERIRGQ